MPNVDKIRALNDQFRTSLIGGRLLLTQGIAGREDTAEILTKVATFDTFDDNNDPHSEHDFGAIDHRGDRIFWKIDYYDLRITSGSPDPGDANVTTRVMTIMLADEY